MRYVRPILRIPVALIGVLLIAMALAALPDALRAARGEGIHGTFSAERRECSNRGCAYYGTWRASPPQTQVVHDVLMDEWPDLPLGSSVDALYRGQTDPAVVYPAAGSLSWVYILIAAGGGAVLALGAWPMISGRFTRRRAGYEPRRARHEFDPD